MQNLGLKKTVLGKFMSKIEILSTHNFLCQKFATVCQKTVRNLQRLLENYKFLPCLLSKPTTLLWLGLALGLRLGIELRLGGGLN